jgi:hypothetical protein
VLFAVGNAKKQHPFTFNSLNAPKQNQQLHTPGLHTELPGSDFGTNKFTNTQHGVTIIE